MRIEMPAASWAETVLRAEDDAHTLTVAAQPMTDWSAGVPLAEPLLAVRMEVALWEPVVLTLTL